MIISSTTDNPYAWLPFHLRRITEPLVAPIRPQFGRPYMRLDLMPVVIGVLILVTGLFVSSMIWQLRVILDNTYKQIVSHLATPAFLLKEFILLLGWFYVAAIFLRFLMPWFGLGYRSSFLRFLFVITEPLLRPLRRFCVAGMFDFSPIIAIFIIQIVASLLSSSIG
ncbi:MAG TPA: YggT family protein [Blastocatellia bacterium]|nr:YggT family protein [Blastocatellia bacterium]